MPELDDISLLKQFAEDNLEAAFAVIIERHINLVYSSALRSVGNPHAAQEISQAVFIILARKAKSLGAKTVLSGWLYQTARLTAANYLRTEMRRQKREQEAYMRSVLNEPASAAWRQIAPLLDDAMGRLGDRDRAAIVLRFFENKNLREVGVALGASEGAAKMRVNRALEKLQKFFTKRGVALSATIIAGAVSANSIHAAPTGLAATISATAVKSSAVAASTLTLVKGALKIMAWTKAKTAIVAGAVVLLATGTATVTVKEIKARQFYIGQSSFPNGDSIEIDSVRRTREQLVVKGRYNLVSADRAQLALYITTPKLVSVPTGPKQWMEISHGRGDFELTDPNLVPGLPHVTMYTLDINGTQFAGVYFGNKDEAARERKLDPSYLAH